LLIATTNAKADSNLANFFNYRSKGESERATKALNNWNPKGYEGHSYKKYFSAINENKPDLYWEIYQDLSKRKRLLKLQHESIKKILEIDLKSSVSLTAQYKNFNKVAKSMLRNLRGQPEGLEYELVYLKWILKEKKIKELCNIERNRWLSQSSLTLNEVNLGLQSCPMTFNDYLYRMRMLIFSGEESKAKEEINEYTKKNNLKEWEKSYIQAVFFSNSGDPISAFDIMLPFEEQLKSKEDFYLNYFYIAQRAGQQEKAEQIINSIIKLNKNSKRSKELNFLKGFLYYQTKRYSNAYKIFDSLVKTHPSHKRRKKNSEYDELTWLQAWTAYLNKDYEIAKKHFKNNSGWTRDKARNLYWLAQSELKLQNNILALEYLRQLASPVILGRYFNYYNYLAWVKFQSSRDETVEGLMRSQLGAIRGGRSMYLLPDVSSNPQKIAESYENMLETIEMTDQGTVTLVNSDEAAIQSSDIEGIKVASSAELKAELSWADELTKWGYQDLAKWHLYEVEKNLKTNSDVEPLTKYYLDNGFYNRAIVLMQNIGNPMSKKLNMAEEELLWKSLFPRAYENHVRKEARKFKISDYLVWSIMKAETQFKADAISPVGAVGLMQFMPYTSKKVAQLLDDEFNPDKLFEPQHAIRYGARYLRKLSDELGNNLHYVAAAYNGGPHRVKLWLKNQKDENGNNLDNDVFIEHIPFNETRTYVKRVLNFYFAYNKLYEKKIEKTKSDWLIQNSKYFLKEPLSLKEEWPGIKFK
jgi:soluble lytic murein transglycosylase